MDKLNIKVDLINVGKLVKENDEFIFLYTSENIKDFISLIMPVRQKPYIHNKLHPIFEMHLPEGYLLSIIKKHFSKLQKTDDFGLLNIMSSSINGRISYETDFIKIANNLTLDDLLHPKSDTLFDELVNKFALNSALSGVQPKVLATIENKATLKIDDYIVKSWGEDYQELALNEYYCMKIVKLSNIDVPEFFISDDEKLFIMKRFDKIEDRYIGFEDKDIKEKDIDKSISKKKTVYYPDDEMLESAFQEYLTMRKKIKKPICTDMALHRAMNTIERLSKGDNDLAVKILNQSVDHCWQGLFALKDNEPHSTNKGAIDWDNV